MLQFHVFLCSGSRSGYIHHHDVRVAEHHIGTLSGHTQEVCGLKWSPDGKYLASGGNDNLLNVWQAGNAEPHHTLTQHTAAVKVRIVELEKLPDWEESCIDNFNIYSINFLDFCNDTRSLHCSIVSNTSSGSIFQRLLHFTTSSYFDRQYLYVARISLRHQWL